MEIEADCRAGLEGYFRFEDLIANLLTLFLNLPASKLDVEITEAIRKIAELLDLDQGVLIQWGEDVANPSLTHSWTTPERLAVPVTLGAEEVPWIHRQVALGRTIKYSRLDDLPEEAAEDKNFLSDSGRKALIFLPLRVGGKVIGALVFASLGSEFLWQGCIVSQLQLVADIFVSVIDRQRSRRELEERLRFEMLLAETSARLINLPIDWIKDKIRDSQRAVCESLDVDRSTLWLTPEAEPGRLQLTTFYQREGCPLVPGGGLDAWHAFPWAAEKVLADQVVVISKMSDLPPEAGRDRDSFVSYGTESTVLVPLSTGKGAVFGVLSFAMVYRQRDWPEALLDRFKLVARIFSSALARQQAERERRESEKRLTLAAESAEAGLWSIEYGSKRVWISAKMRQLFHFDAVREMDYPSFLEGVSPEDRRRFEDAMNRTFQSGEEFKIEHGIKQPDGNLCWMATRGRLQLGFSGRPERLMGASIDITERKRMEGQLRERLDQIEKLQRICESENSYLKQEVNQLARVEIEGQSAAMEEVFKQARQVAETSTTVLILGETGTGKELLARAIHNMSKQKGRPLVTVNCAALPPMLIESELFGREKGAYTGALTKMAGRFEVADNTTIFLDEIGELPVELQGKLLRVIEEGMFERLGSTRPIHVNIRVIAATNRDLAREVKEGRFRNDLFYRLNVFPIVIPPLRERPEDIPLLVWAFVREFQKKMGKRIDSIPKKTMDSLMSYDWPGNGRELRNVIERNMIISNGRSLEVSLNNAASGAQRREKMLKLEDLERSHITRVLDTTSWRVTGKGGAAEILGLKGSTLQSKMKKLGIERSGIHREGSLP